MKIWVMCDLEGVAGLSSFEREVQSDSPYYELAKRLATQELNALVEGALAGGATEIVAIDGHGCGGLDMENLHPELKLGMRWAIEFPWGLDDSWDAGMLFAHHAMEGTPNAILRHSWSHTAYGGVWLNDEPLGEIGTGIRLAGHFGFPVVFITGDRAAVREAQALVPEMEGAVVKEKLPTGIGVSLSPTKSREVIRAGTERAMGLVSAIPPLETNTPCELKLKYSDAAATARAVEYGWQRVDEDTVVCQGADIVEVMRKFYGG
jgi:D-amino peptidase